MVKEDRKQFELDLGNVNLAINDNITIKVELVLDHFNAIEIQEILKLIQGKDTIILDSDMNEYKAISNDVSIGRYNPLHTNEYERYISFEMVYLKSNGTINDVSEWLKGFKNQRLIIKQ